MNDDIAFYHNRYGKKITIERISPLEFRLSGYDPNFIRIRRNGEDITMMDPEGGPLILASRDMIWGGDGDIHNNPMVNVMGEFNPAWADLIIEKIILEESKKESEGKAILYCYYGRKIEWEKLDK